MIITCVSHGREPADIRRLARHLTKTNGQTVAIVATNGLTPNLPLLEALADLRRMTALSARATVGCHHLTINPSRRWSPIMRDAAIDRVLEELGATSHHPWIVVEHSDKTRASPNTDHHFHLVVAHVGTNGRALDMRASFARLEAVARICEMDFGEALTATRHPDAVSKILRRLGRDDVATAMDAAQPPSSPRSSMSSAGRQRASRLDVDVPAAKVTVRSAWQSPGWLDVLQAAGLHLARGRTPGVVLVKTEKGVLVGALDRLAGVPRRVMRSRLEAEMAKLTSKGLRNDRRASGLQKQRGGRTRLAREGAEARHGDDAGRDPNHLGPAEQRRGISGPRCFVADRGAPRNPSPDSDAARRRRRLALLEQRNADAAARRRKQQARAFEADLQTAKSALAARLFGGKLSAEAVATLRFIDMQKRLATLRRGGWVRDAGAVVYASSADAHVVALLVEVVRAKKWPSVVLTGPPDFVAEATRQFVVAGIPVLDAKDQEGRVAPPVAPTSAMEPAAFFQKRVEAAEAGLSEIRQPGPIRKSFSEAETAERLANDLRRPLEDRRELLKQKRDAVQRALDSAGILGRSKARRALAEAQGALDALSLSVDDAREKHETAKRVLDDERITHDAREKRRRTIMADAEKRLVEQREFAKSCMATLDADPAVAAESVVEIERRTRERQEAEIRARDQAAARDAARAARAWKPPGG